MIVRVLGAALLSLCATPIFAACAGVSLVDCTVTNSRKQLELCLDGGRLTYRFGRPGAPELELTRDLSEIAYTPWPGIGRTIWEDVEITNEGVTYAIHSWVERPLDTGEAPRSGTGLIVLQGAEPLAELTCQGDAAADFSPIGEALIARGFCHAPEGWRPGRGGWLCE